MTIHLVGSLSIIFNCKYSVQVCALVPNLKSGYSNSRKPISLFWGMLMTWHVSLSSRPLFTNGFSSLMASVLCIQTFTMMLTALPQISYMALMTKFLPGSGTSVVAQNYDLLFFPWQSCSEDPFYNAIQDCFQKIEYSAWTMSLSILDVLASSVLVSSLICTHRLLS